MLNLLGTLAIEIALFTFLGVLYYFYQRRKILQYEKEKGPMIMGYILQACLSERGDLPSSELDSLIEAIDDYLHNRSSLPPTILMKQYASSEKCSPELKSVIEEGLVELE